MPPITAAADIDAPAAPVYAYVTDPTRFNQWQHRVVKGRMEAGDAGRPHRCVTVRKVGFTARATTAELTHADPPTSWTVRGIDGPIRARVDVAVQPTSEAT